MAKLTAWLVTIVGLLLVLGLIIPSLAMDQVWVQWVIALAVLVVGIGKLVRNYKK
jgi:protein-S-isoprenylcysteine O-methyltransferase Ste14